MRKRSVDSVAPWEMATNKVKNAGKAMREPLAWASKVA